ncbi:MAG: peptidylprolyl isomerase [Lachnospiraceae bacterium]|nr:peptidylprolyl isomerase [Lachnospiraceae bacterium]
MKHRLIQKSICILTAAALILTFTACSSVRIRFDHSQKIVFTCDNVLMTEPEVRLVAAHYASLFNIYYADLLGDDYWNAKVSDNMTYETYVKQYYVQDECKALTALNAMAVHDKVTVPEAEEEQLKDAAKDTFSAMSTSVKDFSGADENDVFLLLKKYYLARQMVQTMLKDEKIGISEEASRVADIQVIRMTDKIDAEDVYNRILHHENFLTLARAYSVDETIDYSVSKSDLTEPFHSVVFSMREGDISELIEAEGSFYIIRLTNSYNTLLSMKNSANLLAQQKYDVWEKTLEQFVKDHRVGVVHQSFDAIKLSDFTEIETFELFRYFN